MHKLLIVSWFVVVVTGCDGGFCNDSEGLGPGLIVLRNDGFVIPTVYGALGSTPERVFPYNEESPFLKCRAIGGLRFEGREAVLDSDHYPELESLGGIGVEVDNGTYAIEDLSGFESVITFGGIGNPFGRNAAIREISGFNAVERVTGSIEASAVVSGFRQLLAIDGTLAVGLWPGLERLERIGGSFRATTRVEELNLPNLQDVGGDLTIQATRLTEIGFPALTHVGGDVLIDSNGVLERWSGFAFGSVVEGNFEGNGNRPIPDGDFDRWLSSGATTVSGSIRVCANGLEGEGRSCVEI